MKRLLLIDDDHDLLEVMRELLEDAEFVVRSRSNAQEIYKDLEEFNPDIIVLDVRLPGVNGGELAYRLKNQENFKIPIVLISANYNEAHNWKERTGAEAFIQKPFEFDHMLQVIESNLKDN